jgi:hypothetical protein
MVLEEDTHHALTNFFVYKYNYFTTTMYNQKKLVAKERFAFLLLLGLILDLFV